MQTKKSRKPVKPVTVILYIFLIALAVIYVAPLLWMLSVSFKDNAGVMAAPFALPEVFHWENYQQAWTMGKLGTALVNSVLVCGITLVVSLFFGAMAAFAIARMRWKLSEAAHTFFLIGMMVPVHCILIPLFVRFAGLGLTNSRVGLMIPYITFSLPMTIFLLTGFFKSMPGELFEAAAIDGATPWQADRYITLPLMRNVCGTCVTLASVAMVSQFDIIYMTTKGGPGTSTLNLPIYLYKAATLENNYGKANAVGVVQIIIGITLVILIKGLFREKKEAA